MHARQQSVPTLPTQLQTLIVQHRVECCTNVCDYVWMRDAQVGKAYVVTPAVKVYRQTSLRML